MQTWKPWNTLKLLPLVALISLLLGVILAGSAALLWFSQECPLYEEIVRAHAGGDEEFAQLQIAVREGAPGVAQSPAYRDMARRIHELAQASGSLGSEESDLMGWLTDADEAMERGKSAPEEDLHFHLEIAYRDLTLARQYCAAGFRKPQ